jgi:type II secretory pathway component GspD/PulD (secretin)
MFIFVRTSHPYTTVKIILVLLFAVATLTLAQAPGVQPGAIPPPPITFGPPLGTPPAGGVPAPASPGTAPTTTAGEGTANTTRLTGDEINYAFEAADQDVLFDEYAGLLGRTIIRSPAVPPFKATFKTQSPLTRAEAIRAFDSIFAMNNVSTVMYEEKFVKIVPSLAAGPDQGDFHMVEGAMSTTADSLTNIPPTAQYISQIIQLKYAKPSEMIPVLQPYGRIQNGIQAIDSSGILVIRDHAENIRRMMEMIRLVDVTSLTATVEPEIIPIKYALAEDIASVLSSLTSGGGGGTTVGRGAGGTTGARTGARRGVSTTSSGGYGPGGAQSGLSPLGARGATPTPTPAGGNTFAERLQNIVNRVSGGEFQVLGEVKIIADARTNSLLIFAGREDMDMIKKIIAKLDVVLAQVLIEAIVMEVSLNDDLNYGISAAQRPKSFTDNLSGFGAMLNGQFLNNVTNAFPTGLGEGFSYFGKIGDTWEVALKAIAKDSSINVLSRPRVQTSHAKLATLQVGDTVPYVTGTYFGYGVAGQSSSQYQQTFVGIQIDVTPLINQEGLVIMDIQQVNIEQLGTPTRIDGNDVPTTSKRYAAANVAVNDGETIILGGFISSTRSKSKQGVPILKDIPLLGALFSSTGKKNNRVELIVLMRPTVLRTPEIAAKTARDETSKLPGVRSAVRDFEDEYKTRMRKAGEEPELFRTWNQRTNTEPVVPQEITPDGTH